MYKAAQNYLKALERAESQEDLDALRNEMDRLEAMYSENPAYLALIEQENLVKKQEVKDNEARVNKGTSPYTPIQEYRDALPYLESLLGIYCSYCGAIIDHAPEIEHVVSKSKGGDKTEWKNLLLACKYCNTRKSNKTTSENKNDYLWPDENNTELAYDLCRWNSQSK